MAQEITFTGTTIANCANGIELSEETNNRGDYNVEFLTIDSCAFNNVKANVIDYYRGGYDESTIGGNLRVSNSTFTSCGSAEANGILLNHRGIIHVNIDNNTFANNRVKRVSILWGAKDNHESGNKLTNSGSIEVQQNLALKLMY
jgi:poly(beta-D-mannuronate) lyase